MIEDLNLKFSSYQDPDSQWNSMFKTYATPDAALTIAASLAFQGASVTLTYDNGQTKTQDSFASLRAGADFAGVSSGEDYYNKFCNPDAAVATTTSSAVVPTPTSNQTVTSTTLARPAPTIQNYPYPIVRDSGSNTTSGYFLNGTGYDNVAVLAVSAFSPSGNIGSVEYLTNFQSTVSSFLAQSKAAGKNRLVIDVTANGGGFVVAGYELFAQVCNPSSCVILNPGANTSYSSSRMLADSRPTTSVWQTALSTWRVSLTLFPTTSMRRPLLNRKPWPHCHRRPSSATSCQAMSFDLKVPTSPPLKRSSARCL